MTDPYVTEAQAEAVAAIINRSLIDVPDDEAAEGDISERVPPEIAG